MKVTYDKSADAMYIKAKKGKYHASKEFGDSIVDFSERKELLGIEILNASKNLGKKLCADCF